MAARAAPQHRLPLRLLQGLEATLASRVGCVWECVPSPGAEHGVGGGVGGAPARGWVARARASRDLSAPVHRRRIKRLLKGCSEERGWHGLVALVRVAGDRVEEALDVAVRGRVCGLRAGLPARRVVIDGRLDQVAVDARRVDLQPDASRAHTKPQNRKGLQQPPCQPFQGEAQYYQ